METQMFYVKFVDGKAVAVQTEYPRLADGSDAYDRSFQSRWEWKTMDRVEQIARELTEATGELFLGIDNGGNVSPRYDVIRAPKVGDLVSKSFNGDTYPEGEIVSISASLKLITTSTGCKFYRRRLSGAWVEARTWSLVPGHRYEQNPSF